MNKQRKNKSWNSISQERARRFRETLSAKKIKSILKFFAIRKYEEDRSFEELPINYVVSFNMNYDERILDREILERAELLMPVLLEQLKFTSPMDLPRAVNVIMGASLLTARHCVSPRTPATKLQIRQAIVRMISQLEKFEEFVRSTPEVRYALGDVLHDIDWAVGGLTVPSPEFDNIKPISVLRLALKLAL